MAPLACGHVNEYMHVYDLSMWLVDHGIEHAPCGREEWRSTYVCARSEPRARPQTADMPQATRGSTASRPRTAEIESESKLITN